MTTTRICSWRTVLVLLVLLGIAAAAWSRGMIGGRYLQDTGREIVLELDVGTPAPASLILRQFLAPHTRIVGAEPPYKKYESATGEVLWLFSGLRPGTLSVRLHLAAPHAEPVRARVRCLDPDSGRYVTTPIP